MIDFSKFTNDQLWEIYKSTNVFEWNELLGDKPDRFDKLPKFRFHWWHYFPWIRTKDDYTHPIWCLIPSLLPDGFIEEKEKENKEKIEEWFKRKAWEDVASPERLKARLGKRLFEHMNKQPE